MAYKEEQLHQFHSCFTWPLCLFKNLPHQIFVSKTQCLKQVYYECQDNTQSGCVVLNTFNRICRYPQLEIRVMNQLCQFLLWSDGKCHEALNTQLAVSLFSPSCLFLFQHSGKASTGCVSAIFLLGRWLSSLTRTLQNSMCGLTGQRKLVKRLSHCRSKDTYSSGCNQFSFLVPDYHVFHFCGKNCNIQLNGNLLRQSLFFQVFAEHVSSHLSLLLVLLHPPCGLRFARPSKLVCVNVVVEIGTF